MRSGTDLNEGGAGAPLDTFAHRPGEGLVDRGFCWTYDGEVIPQEIFQSIDSAEEELSEEMELAFVRYWMEHAPDKPSLFDHWYDLWSEHHELEQQLRRLQDSRSTTARLEATAVQGRLRSLQARLAWITDGMEAVIEGRPPPSEPAEVETVKVADLFGTVIDTHLTESQLHDPFGKRSRRG